MKLVEKSTSRRAGRPKRLLLALLAVVMLGSACGRPPGPEQTSSPGGATSSPPAKARSVRIDANLPMTGGLALYGTGVREGVNLAVEDLGRSDPAGPAFKIDWQDNAGDPKTAVSVFQKQYLEPPDIYVSGIKPQTMAIMDQVTAKGTPHFVWIFDAFINKNNPKKNNFRTFVSYKIEAPLFVKYAADREARRVAIVYVQLPHSAEEFEQLVIPTLKKQGAAQVLVEAFDFGKKDFKDIAVKVKEFKPDLIILNGFQADLVGLVRALRPLKLITDGNTVATYDMMDAAAVLGPDELEGIRVVAPLFNTRPDRPKVAEWRKHFRERYNKEPLYMHAYAYDMAQVFQDAAKRVPEAATPETWIKTLRETNLEGITGPLKFDEDGDLMTDIELGVYRAGKLVPLAEDKAAGGRVPQEEGTSGTSTPLPVGR